MNTVVCIGDSITYGRVGASYFEMLKSKFGGKFKFINSGINGNLSYDVLKRIDKVTNMKPDIAILLVGTNDVWATYSEKTMKAYIRKNKLPERPSKESYARNFTEILKRLKTASIEHIGVMSLPLITEDPEHILFKRSAEYSELIKKITSQMDLCYIDLNERQRDYLTKNKKNPSSDLQAHHIEKELGRTIAGKRISVDGRSCSSKQHGGGLDQGLRLGVLEKAFASRWLIYSMLILRIVIISCSIIQFDRVPV